jgi:hypothetical protein
MCLMWCLWRERNAWHFEDIETLVTELRKIVVNTLNIWTSAHHSLFGYNFAGFFTLYSSFLYLRGSLVYSMYTKVVPLYALFMI